MPDLEECKKYEEKSESEIMNDLSIKTKEKLEEKAEKIKRDKDSKKQIVDNGEITLSQLA